MSGRTPKRAHTIRRVRQFLITALTLGTLALSGCASHASHVKNDALGRTCDQVNLGIPNDRSERHWHDYAKVIDRWSSKADPGTQKTLGSISQSAAQFASRTGANRQAAWNGFWGGFGKLEKVCKGNGTPMKP
jgi:hypothetical protein